MSRLVPVWGRREFRAEWEAELATAWIDRPVPAVVAGSTSLRSSGVRRGARRLVSLPPAVEPDMILQDIRFALRLMRLRIGYTAIVIVTLALSIGATTAMFSAIHAVLLRPLPFRSHRGW